MKNIYQILFPVLLFYSGCSLFDTEPNPLEPIQTFFYAEINGERFDANRANAVLNGWRGYTILTFSGSHHYDEIYPYHEIISFNNVYKNSQITYPLLFDSVATESLGFPVPFVSYYENDGDVIISDYQAPEDSDGFVTVELEELEDGRKTISGTFEMTVYLNKRIETAFPQQEQDTLVITNGQYLLELRDFRDE